MIRKAFHCALFLNHNSAISNLDDLSGPARCSTETRNLIYQSRAMNDLAEHDMLAIEPTGGHGRDEELRAVGVGASIGHREQIRAVVLQGEVLIVEPVAKDRLATSAIVLGEVATLEHEFGDDTVEQRVFVAIAF